jgi:hypothetical protein
MESMKDRLMQKMKLMKEKQQTTSSSQQPKE